MKRITPRQARFISSFCRCRNGAQAAREAGYNPDRARMEAYRLRHDPNFSHVEAELLRRLADKEQQDQIQHEIMTNVLIQRITFNPARLQDESGRFLLLREMEPEDAQHIQSVQEAGYKHGGASMDDEEGDEEADSAAQAGKSISLKLTSQHEAIKILGKHNGYFTPRESAGETAPYRAAEEALTSIFDRIRRRAADPVPGASDDGAAPNT